MMKTKFNNLKVGQMVKVEKEHRIFYGVITEVMTTDTESLIESGLLKHYWVHSDDMCDIAWSDEVTPARIEKGDRFKVADSGAVKAGTPWKEICYGDEVVAMKGTPHWTPENTIAEFKWEGHQFTAMLKLEDLRLMDSVIKDEPIPAPEEVKLPPKAEDIVTEPDEWEEAIAKAMTEAINPCGEVVLPNITPVMNARHLNEYELIAMKNAGLVAEKDSMYDHAFDKMVDEYGLMYAFSKIEEKLSRMKQLHKNGIVHEESLLDSVKDLNGYSLLMLKYLNK